MKVLFVLAALSISLWANRFEQFKLENSICKECVYFNTIAYPDSQALYTRELKAYIRNNIFNNTEARTNDSKVKELALYLAVPLCWADAECKELIWDKRNGTQGFMSFEMYRTVALLMPEKLSLLLMEFKRYPLHKWRNYNLRAFSFLSFNPEIKSSDVVELKRLTQEYQREWNKRNSSFTTETVTAFFNLVDKAVMLQQSRTLGDSDPLPKSNPTYFHVLFENLIHDENWDRFCPELESLVKKRTLIISGSGSTSMWTRLLQKRCGQLSKDGIRQLKESLLSPTYAQLMPVSIVPTPVLNKVLREYTQELLAEQKKKNPVKWRIWPEIVKPLK